MFPIIKGDMVTLLFNNDIYNITIIYRKNYNTTNNKKHFAQKQ